MRLFNQTEKLAHDQRHPTKPILYWEAWAKSKSGSPLHIIDQNNSIQILRYRYGQTVIYKAIR